MFIQYILAATLIAQAFGLQSRITDGVTAKPHEFPYQVSIAWGIPPLIKYRHVCGGSIISEQWILTAGHCITELPLQKVSRLQVQAGKHIVNEAEEGQQNRQVSMKLAHRLYPGGVAQHDIGLLRLKEPLVFNDFIQPVALPQQNYKHAGKTVLSGWGSTSKKFLPVLPKELQKAEIPIVDFDTCYESFTNIGGEVELFDTQICTGPVGGTVSACSGDSGGPLVQLNDEGGFSLVGIVSFGAYPCGSGMPSVYTRVSSYVDWIQNKLVTMQ